MTPRSSRRSVNPNPEKAHKAAHLNGKRAQRIPFWPGGPSSDKSRIHSRRPHCYFIFRLQQSGGPYIPDGPEPPIRAVEPSGNLRDRGGTGDWFGTPSRI